jgi:hypothetical protein
MDTEKAHFAAVTAALALSATAPARRSTRPLDLAIRTPPMFLPKFPEASAKSCGRSSRTSTGDVSHRSKLDCPGGIIALGKLEKPRLSARFSPPEPGSPAAGPSSRAGRTFSQKGEVSIALGSARLRHRLTKLRSETVALPIARVLFKFET